MYGFIQQEALGGTPHPSEPQSFESRDHALRVLHAQAVEHFQFSESSLTLTLFEGSPAGDETICGYPDYPDQMYRADTNGSGLAIHSVSV